MFQFRGIFQSCIKEKTFWCCCIVFLHKRETSHNKLFKLHLNTPQHWRRRRRTQIVDFTSLCWYFYWSPALIISFWAFSRRVLECVCLFCSETKKRVDRGWRRERRRSSTRLRWRRRIRLCLWLTVGLQSDGLLPSDGPFTHWVIRPATPTFSPSASWFRRNTETRCLVTDDILRFHNRALQIVLQQDTHVFQQERKIYK